ncbi:MAG: hypothetical protein WC959_05400 [Kiritimatiellales bacterium]
MVNKPKSRTFQVEYELPSLRAIYLKTIADVPDEDRALKRLRETVPNARIRRIQEI